MMIQNPQTIIFKHMIELTSCGCFFCYTQEEMSGRTRLFLIFKEQRRVYARNGLKATWEELANPDEGIAILEAFDQAIRENKVPKFSTTINELAYV